MSLLAADGEQLEVPTLSQEVYDNQGAGDTTIAVLTLVLIAGGSLRDAAVLANAAAGIVVAKMGTAIATAAEIRAALPAVVQAMRASREPE